MYHKKSSRLLLWALAALGSALLFTSTAFSQNLTKLRITIPVPVINFYPLYVAADKGFFAEEGYEVEIIPTSGDGPDIDALISGSVQFTVSTPNRLFTAYEQGKPLLAAMNLGNRVALECFLNKEIADKHGITGDSSIEQTMRAMKGETVAGTRPGAFTYLLLVSYAKRFGLTPQKDLDIIGIGGPGAMLPAVENKRIAMGCIGSPTPELANSRGKAIVVTKNMSGDDAEFDNFLYEVLYVMPEYAKANPDTVKGVIRALQKSLAYIHKTSSTEQLPILRKRFSGLDDNLLVAALDTNKPTYPTTGVLTQEAVDKAGKFLFDTGVITTKIPWTAVSSNEYNSHKGQ